MRRCEASAEECGESLPGDALIPEPAVVETRATTVAAPPPAVWPWLMQMGAGRAGWYSYDRPGVGIWRLIPQFEDLAVGSVLPVLPHVAFRVAQLEHDRALVLSLEPSGIQPGPPVGRPSGPGGMRDLAASWTFALRPLPDGSTRLIERVRIGAPGDRLGPRLVSRLTAFGVVLAQRKQLLGIKARAERMWRGHVEGPVESHVA